jgi:ribA/ribD-fused uncharacterized protein
MDDIERSLTDVKGNTVILFNTGWSTFSNFYLAPFEVNGWWYRTVEQYYQSEKAAYFGDFERAEMIYRSVAPSKCKKLAHEIRNFKKDVWQTVAPQVMAVAVKEKFHQNAAAREKLISTGDATLVEATLYDQFWGSGLHISDDANGDPKAWRGCNRLGYTLMEVRAQLRGD